MTWMSYLSNMQGKGIFAGLFSRPGWNETSVITMSLKKDLSGCPIKKLPRLHFLNLFFFNLFSIFLKAKCSLLLICCYSSFFSSLNKIVVIAKLIRETKPKLTNITSERAARRQTKVKVYRACSSLQFVLMPVCTSS